MSKYTDVQTLQRTGIWPNGEIPQWAVERATELQCGPCSGAVLETAYESEIQDLQVEIQNLKAQLAKCESSLADAPWRLIRHNRHVKNLEAQLRQRAEEDSYVQRVKDFCKTISRPGAL